MHYTFLFVTRLLAKIFPSLPTTQPWVCVYKQYCVCKSGFSFYYNRLNEKMHAKQNHVIRYGGTVKVQSLMHHFELSLKHPVLTVLCSRATVNSLILIYCVLKGCFHPSCYKIRKNSQSANSLLHHFQRRNNKHPVLTAWCSRSTVNTLIISVMY